MQFASIHSMIGTDSHAEQNSLVVPAQRRCSVLTSQHCNSDLHTSINTCVVTRLQHSYSVAQMVQTINSLTALTKFRAEARNV